MKKKKQGGKKEKKCKEAGSQAGTAAVLGFNLPVNLQTASWQCAGH